ncbi:MAG: Maf family protein [Sorangiineae bacterium]|nr:Maf family protein [Polyangiaceae bacterium]MEB2324423.1 Maf family protein [Sorangiineae bacterium]
MVISEGSPLVLGSGSPRRREILETLGLAFRAQPAEVDEARRPREPADEFLERVVATKLAAVSENLGEAPLSGVLVADTIVVVDGEILGKPAGVGEAAEMLRRLAGREHEVQTRYALSLADAPAQLVAARTVSSRVVMRSATVDELARYAASGEGLDKAGAYAVQGLGSFLVERVEGSYTNVVGLPACELVMDLRAAGLIMDYP